jgi:hypothetical protein
MEKTHYETGPVESLFEAICAFADAYDVLQTILTEAGEDENFADALRVAMYRPVRPQGADLAPVSLYEIGVVFMPSASVGKYGINKRKLTAALAKRENDIRALMVQQDGILPQLCEMLSEFLFPHPPEDEEDPAPPREPNEFVHAAALRFLNECRRLIAMWG